MEYLWDFDVIKRRQRKVGQKKHRVWCLHNVNCVYAHSQSISTQTVHLMVDWDPKPYKDTETFSGYETTVKGVSTLTKNKQETE